MEEAARDDKVVAITAAMPSGTGLDKFAQKYPERNLMSVLPSSMP